MIERKRKLQSIIDENLADANDGCADSQMIVVNAQWLLDKIAEKEILPLTDPQDETEDGCFQAALA